jgi:hypothetical protein
LGVEGIVGELELGREPALVANDGVKAAIRHLLWLIVELGTLVVVRVVTVHELHGLGRIERLRLPAEPDIEIDRIAVNLEVELLDVVDVGADHDLVRAFRSLCGSDRLDHFVGGASGVGSPRAEGDRAKRASAAAARHRMIERVVNLVVKTGNLFSDGTA